MGFDDFSIRARSGGALPDIRDGKLHLNGETNWLVEGAGLDRLVDALPKPMVERIGTVLVLNFGNAVGRFKVLDIGTIHVTSGKWTEAHYEGMLADITERMSALPFTASDTAGLPYDRQISRHSDVLYQAFVYLRHILSDVAPRHVRLRPALESILREPHSRLSSTRHETPLPRAARVDPRFITQLAAGAIPLMRAPAAMAALPLAVALRGHIPPDVQELRVRRDVDTAENRFIKNFLDLATTVISRVETLAESKTSSERHWTQVLEDCQGMRKTLGPYAAASLWDEVGRMTHVPVSSTVLQRRRGYRETYSHFLKLRAATRLPLDEDQLQDLLEVKDISELYELWCYFEVVEAISGLLGRPKRVDSFRPEKTHIKVRQGFRVTWPNGTRCVYNRSFGSSGKPRSYSLQMRPDIVVEAASGLHIFDAKFKLKKPKPSEDGGGEEDGLSTVKRADIEKMHAYRDAIARVRSARVVYPGETTVFHSTDGTPCEGVGALPLLPGMRLELRTVLGELL